MDTDRSEDLLDHPAVSDRLFYPRKTSTPATFEVSAGDCRLGCFRREFDAAWPWVVYFHGNAELAEECDESIAELFEKCQANVCFVEYRGFGTSDDRTRLGTMLGDGQKVFEAMGVPARRTIAFGRSIGSLFAIELVSRVPELGGLVIESGIAVPDEHWPVDEIAAFGRLSQAQLTRRFEEKVDHKQKLKGYYGPMLVMHTRNDTLVKASNADRLHEGSAGRTNGSKSSSGGTTIRSFTSTRKTMPEPSRHLSKRSRITTGAEHHAIDRPEKVNAKAFL